MAEEQKLHMVPLSIVLCHESIHRTLDASRLEYDIGMLRMSNLLSHEVPSGEVINGAWSTGAVRLGSWWTQGKCRSGSGSSLSVSSSSWRGEKTLEAPECKDQVHTVPRVDARGGQRSQESVRLPGPHRVVLGRWVGAWGEQMTAEQTGASRSECRMQSGLEPSLKGLNHHGRRDRHCKFFLRR